MKVKKILALSLSVAMLAGGALSVSAQGVSDVFSAKYYASKNSDLAAAGVTSDAALLQHAVNSGIAEDRDVSPILDVAEYATYPDLKAAFGNDWNAYVDHYLQIGIKEGRTKGVKFDLVDYANKNADIKAAYGEDYVAIAKHYVNYGINENRPGGTISAKTTTSSSSPSSTSSSSNSSSNSKPAVTPTQPTEASNTITPPAENVHEAYGHVHDWDVISSDYNNYVSGENATCTNAGYAIYRCPAMIASITFTDGSVVWMLADEVANYEVPAGKFIRSRAISQCSATYRKELPKLHHTIPLGGAYIVDHPTCTATGTATYVCEVCGEPVNKEVIPALGHDYKTVKVVAPSGCTGDNKGYTEKKCARCGDVIKVDERVLHHVATASTYKAATCKEQGEKTGYCSECGLLQTEIIPITDHAAKDLKTVPVYVDTYTENASVRSHALNTITYCTYCGDITVVVESAPEACVDGDNDGVCDTCLRSMTRQHVASQKKYNVGESFKGDIQ